MNTTSNKTPDQTHAKNLARRIVRERDARSVFFLWLSERICHLADELSNTDSNFWRDKMHTKPHRAVVQKHTEYVRQLNNSLVSKSIFGTHLDNLEQYLEDGISYLSLTRLAEAELQECVNEIVTKILWESSICSMEESESTKQDSTPVQNTCKDITF